MEIDILDVTGKSQFDDGLVKITTLFAITPQNFGNK